MARMSPSLSRTWPAVRLLYFGVVAGLLIYSALTLWLGIAGAFYPYQLDYGEGIVLWFARQAALGQALYRPLLDPPLTVNNYPPVAMFLTAPFYLIFGPSYAPGRLLNLAGALLVAYLLYRMARAETGARHWSLLAPLLFLGSTFIYHWAPLFRVDLIGLGLTWTGIYLAWRGEATALGPAVHRRFWVAAFLLFVLAVYTKQSFLAAPGAAILALFVRNRRQGVLFGIAFAAAGAMSFLLGNLLTAGGFWAGLVTANASSWLWSTFWPVFSLWLGTYGLLFVIAAVTWAYRVRRERKLGVLEFYLPLSFFSVMLSGRVGAWENYYFEAIAAICLFSVFAFVRGGSVQLKRRRGESSLRWPGSPAVAQEEGLSKGLTASTWPRLVSGESLLLVAFALELLLYLPEHDPQTAARLMAEEGEANRALAPVLAAARGQVIAEDMGALVTSGQPVIYYTFVYSNLARAGLYDQSWELANLRNCTFPLVVLEHGTREDVDHYRRFTHEFLSELDASYALETRLGKYELYRPAPIEHPAAFDFEGKIELVGWSRTPAVFDASTRSLTYTLLWQARSDPVGRYTTFVHLEDSTGRIVAQDDHEPRAGAFPTLAWKAGDKVREVHVLEWKQPLAPGSYYVRLGWYDAATGDRLSVGDEDVITLDRIES